MVVVLLGSPVCARRGINGTGKRLMSFIAWPDGWRWGCERRAMLAVMLETFTLDQLRALIVVIEEGSFSAAARKLHRVQSAVSTAMANLEAQLGVPLWDRSTKVARLT